MARAREFAPVKNAEGADSPETARALVAAEVRALVRERGRSTAAGPLAPLDPLEHGAVASAPHDPAPLGGGMRHPTPLYWVVGESGWRHGAHARRAAATDCASPS